MKTLVERIDQLVTKDQRTWRRDGHSVRVELARSGRTQTVQLSQEDGRYRFESTVLPSREVTRKHGLWRDIAYRAWRRNAMKELVTFAFDENDRLIGVIEVPAGTLQDEELRVYIETLAKECDRFEYALKGWDRE